MFRLGTDSEDGLVSATAVVARLCRKLQTFEAASIPRMLFTNHPVACIRDLGRSAASSQCWAPTALAAALRAFFGVDAQVIAKAAKFALEG